jgi:hypothetical protein
LLWRRWDDRPLMIVVMLNPSTVDASIDDPTILRVIVLATAAGCGGFVVVNAFALRSSAPELLRADPAGSVGPENDDHIRAIVRLVGSGPRLVAWGANVGWKELAFRTAELSALVGPDVLCWATTQAGHPKHPLARGLHRIPDGTLPMPYPWPA